MTEWYILDDEHKPVPSSLEGWFEWTKEKGLSAKRIAVDELDGIKVSTVFLGLDHSMTGGRPVLFETMIFGGEWDQYQERYHTWDEALAGHKEALEKVKHSA